VVKWKVFEWWTGHLLWSYLLWLCSYRCFTITLFLKIFIITKILGRRNEDGQIYTKVYRILILASSLSKVTSFGWYLNNMDIGRYPIPTHPSILATSWVFCMNKVWNNDSLVFLTHLYPFLDVSGCPTWKSC